MEVHMGVARELTNQANDPRMQSDPGTARA